MKKITSVDILGTKISVFNYPTILSIIKTQINIKSEFICAAAVHLVMESFNNKKFQKLINKSLITTPDGMPLVWLAQFILKRKVERIYGPNLMLKICEMAQKNKYKIFLLGGAKKQSTYLNDNLIKKYPKLKIVGIQETPIRPIPHDQNQIILSKIKKTKPDIIFVGLGCPLQEKWMIANYRQTNKGVFIGVGAAFDFISKRVKQSPVWIQNIGLEWFFRFLQDPKRLWKRYLIYNTQFIFQIIKNYIKFNEKENTLH